MKKTEQKKRFELVDLRRLKGVHGGRKEGAGATSEVVTEKIGGSAFV